MDRSALDKLYRQYSQPMLAYLFSLARDLDQAQELWHETFLDAMRQWQDQIPENRLAWLKRTAKNKFIDRYRRLKMSAEKAVLIQAVNQQSSDELDDTEYGDEQLKLIFTCCHPALDFDKQVALTLNIVAGLTTAEIAQVLLLNPKTLEQRLTRAKRKIKQAGIPFVIPESKSMPERLNAVLKTLYLMYTTGTNQQQDSLDLASNACQLVRRLNRLLPNQAEIEGVLALVLFHQARQAARYNDQGEIIPLSEQQRHLWHQGLISEADTLLSSAMSRQSLGIYQIQAAIQGVHCQSLLWQETDWAQIEALYRVHLTLENSPVVLLNGIYAMSMSRGIDYALSQLLQLEKQGLLSHYAPFYAVKADLYYRLKDFQAAYESFTLASTLAHHSQEKAHFARQAQQALEMMKTVPKN